jgi:hypothetical protein
MMTAKEVVADYKRRWGIIKKQRSEGAAVLAKAMEQKTHFWVQRGNMHPALCIITGVSDYDNVRIRRLDTDAEYWVGTWCVFPDSKGALRSLMGWAE